MVCRWRSYGAVHLAAPSHSGKLTQRCLLSLVVRLRPALLTSASITCEPHHSGGVLCSPSSSFHFAMAAVLFRASAAALRRTQPQSIPMAALRSVRTVPRRFAGGAPPPPPPPPPTPRGVIAWYGAQLAARPLLTKAISAGVLGFAGDVIAQLAVEQRGGFSLDLHRLGVFTGVGAVIIAPVLHVWYALPSLPWLMLGGLKNGANNMLATGEKRD